MRGEAFRLPFQQNRLLIGHREQPAAEGVWRDLIRLADGLHEGLLQRVLGLVMVVQDAEEEPEHPDYFKNPEMRKRYATRGVIHTWANPDGTRKVELTGPLTKKRMETVDEEFTREAMRFMEESKKEDKPFFLWWNSTRMHIWTLLKAESQGKTGLGIYPDGMVEHDAMVGQLLDKLAELGLDQNTIVM